MKPDFSIVVPGYNEEDIAAEVVEKLDAFLAEQPFTAEVLFVDDGSQDRTGEILQNAVMRHAIKRIIRFSKNFGTHAAVRAGFLHASADRCMFYYMDMPEDLSIIRTFYDKLNEGYNIVCSKRRGYKMSLGSKIFSKLQKKYVCPDYPEEGISIMAIDGKVKHTLNENVEGNSSIFFQIYNLGFRKCLVESRMRERVNGGSKWTFQKKVRLFIDTFVSFSHMPIRAISTIGCVFAIVGILYALGIILIKLFHITELSAGWPMLISVILIGFGITNISLGVISEYLVRALDASRKRPVFVIDSIIGEDGKEEEPRA